MVRILSGLGDTVPMGEVDRQTSEGLRPRLWGRCGIDECQNPLFDTSGEIELSEIFEQTDVVLPEVEVQVAWCASRLADARRLEFNEVVSGAKLEAKIDLMSFAVVVETEFSFKHVDEVVDLETMEQNEHLALEPSLQSGVVRCKDLNLQRLREEPLVDFLEHLVHGPLSSGPTLWLTSRPREIFAYKNGHIGWRAGAATIRSIRSDAGET